MLKIYGIPACNTMKKTFEYLQSKGIPFEFINYKKNGINSNELQSFIDQLTLGKVFNKQGSTYRQLPEEIKLTLNDPKKAFEFLLEKNSAIKRPILVDKNRMIAGFNQTELDKLLNI
jgi:Spx/MgsR family transcriptional regulator